MSSAAYKWGGEVSIFLEVSIVALAQRSLCSVPYLIQPISLAFSLAAAQASERKCGKLTLHVSSCTFLAENVLAMRRLSSAFIGDAEVGSRHRYDNLVAGDLDTNF